MSLTVIHPSRNAANLFYKMSYKQWIAYNKFMAAIIESQKILASHITPNSNISEKKCINQLLGVLDNRELVKLIRELK